MLDSPGVEAIPARIVFMGSPEFAVPSLRGLVAQSDLARVVGVVSQPDKPAGRGQRLTAPPVKVYAAEQGLPVLQPAKMKAAETHAALAELAPDLIVVAAYGRILPRAILELPRLGCVNVHASLLPRHRGASPITHAILAGDSQTGVSIMRMEEGLDTGPVYGARAVSIDARATTGTLTAELARLGAELLVELIPDILAGRRQPVQQPDQGATYAPLLDKKDGWLSFEAPAGVLERRVRAMSPWPLAFTALAGQRVQVLDAHVGSSHLAAGTAGIGTNAGAGTGTAAGTVLDAGANGVTVACGEDALVLDTVKPAGKAAMKAAAWVAGRAVKAGDRFDVTSPP
jgi:methionyl-tRNA formyltransferase